MGKKAVIRSFFMIGNKRSGTSQLVRILNLHPEIFISHESDIVWILYQFQHGSIFRSHPSDSDRGMRKTLELAGKLLDPNLTPLENFERVQRHLMDNGTPWLPKQSKPNLKWIGDKKPFQLTDPNLFHFVLKHFPNVRFLHLVRHPLEVAVSSMHFNQTRNGDFWLGMTLEEKLERWAYHEKEAQRLLTESGVPVLRVQYEALCRGTEKVLKQIFEFLDVDPIPSVLRRAAQETLPVFRALPKSSHSQLVYDIAKTYGYDLTRVSIPPWEKGKIFCWRSFKKLKLLRRESNRL